MIFNNIHFVGIGGISMSGLAKVMLQMGKRVSGSDVEENDQIKSLRQMGVKITIGHDKSNLDADVEQVIVTGALAEDNPEVLEARKRNIPVWRRSQLLGAMMRDKIGIAVAGMHGKTTVSAMISTILHDNNDDPTVFVGANVKSIGTNANLGDSDLVVAEACEYQKSFLDLDPQIAVITNIEEEHLDTYKDIKGILEAFSFFATKVPTEGLLVGCLDDKNVLKVINASKANKIGYGFGKCPSKFSGVYWQIVRLRQDNQTGYQVKVDDELLEEVISLDIPGEFNVLNAVAALIVADFLTVPMKVAVKSLNSFQGASRRFDVLGEKDGVVVVDDYGHHPTEVTNSISVVGQSFPDRYLWVVFWPHQYERTRDFWEKWPDAFVGAKKVIVLDIYQARETKVDKEEVNSKKLVESMKKKGIDAVYIPTWQEARQYVEEGIQNNSVLLTQGAGPVDELAREYLKK